MCAKELSDELIECWKMLPDFLNYENLVKFEFQINHREFLQITMSRYNPGNVGLNKKLNIKKKEDFGVVFFWKKSIHFLKIFVVYQITHSTRVFCISPANSRLQAILLI